MAAPLHQDTAREKIVNIFNWQLARKCRWVSREEILANEVSFKFTSRPAYLHVVGLFRFMPLT